MLLILIHGIFTDQLEREIALRLIESADDIEKLNVSRLAGKCQCSAASINKFCRRLGFDDFRTMKAQMKLTMDVRRGQLEHHMNWTKEEDVLKRISALSYGDTDIGLFAKTAAEINRMIHESPRVILLGAGFPEALTLHYQEDMIMMHKTVYSVPIGYKLTMPADVFDSTVLVISLTGRIVDYFQHQFIELTRRNPNVVMISGKTSFSQLNDSIKILPLAIEGDNEDANTLLVEVMRYMKYMYYMTYGGC